MGNLHSLQQAYEQLRKDNQKVARSGLLAHSAVNTLIRKIVGKWQIEISRRQTGVTVRRDQFTALLRHSETDQQETLQGFATKEAAMTAAEHRIEVLSAPPLKRHGGTRTKSSDHSEK